jgi:DNA-binding transcriptional LysR family regulator
MNRFRWWLPLINRERQRVHLSENGRRYHQETTMALEPVRRSTKTLRQQQHSSHVTLSSSTAFASWSMLPRLARFRQDNPGISPGWQHQADHLVERGR